MTGTTAIQQMLEELADQNAKIIATQQPFKDKICELQKGLEKATEMQVAVAKRLVKAIKAAVLGTGSTIKASRLQAIDRKGALKWKTDRLDEHADEFPGLAAKCKARDAGSVAIKGVKS